MNSGDSITRSRMNRPTTLSAIPNRNGTRQPQVTKLCSLSNEARMNSEPVANPWPRVAPVCTSDPQKPLRCGGLVSVTTRTAPAHSPPSPTP